MSVLKIGGRERGRRRRRRRGCDEKGRVD